MNEPSITIPPSFWKTVTDEEFSTVVRLNGLNKELSARLWKMTDRQSEPPEFIEVWLNRKDVEKLPKPPWMKP